MKLEFGSCSYINNPKLSDEYQYGTNWEFMDIQPFEAKEPCIKLDQVKETDDNDSVTGIKIRTRQFQNLPSFPLQGTASRKLPVNAILRSAKLNSSTSLSYNEEISSLTGVDHSPFQDTGVITSLPFQGTANRRIRFQRKLQVGSINQKHPPVSVTEQDSPKQKSCQAYANGEVVDQEPSVLSRAKTTLFSIPAVLVVPGLCVGIVALWKGIKK